jgi:hypothetical protein
MFSIVLSVDNKANVYQNLFGLDEENLKEINYFICMG